MNNSNLIINDMERVLDYYGSSPSVTFHIKIDKKGNVDIKHRCNDGDLLFDTLQVFDNNPLPEYIFDMYKSLKSLRLCSPSWFEFIKLVKKAKESNKSPRNISELQQQLQTEKVKSNKTICNLQKELQIVKDENKQLTNYIKKMDVSTF